MIPDEIGRYCNSCKKSVIDFTAKTDEEIQEFFINDFNEPVCARFKNTQIHHIVIDLPQNIFSTKMPMWMRFLAACLIIFGISIFPFQTTVAGKAPAEISFFQDEQAEIKKDKKPRILKKKKRRKYRKPDFLLENIVWTTLGYMPTPFPGPPIYAAILDTPSKSNLIPNTQIGLSNEHIPQKEQHRPTPHMPTEFILPSILLFRKENHSQARD